MRPPRPAFLLLAALMAAFPVLSRAHQAPAPAPREDAAKGHDEDPEEPCAEPREEAPAPAPKEGEPAALRPKQERRCARAEPLPDRPADGTRRPLPPAAPEPDARRADERHGRETAAGDAARRGAQALLGTLRQGEAAPGGAVGGALPPGAPGATDLRALNAAPAAQSPYANTLQTGSVPSPGEHGGDLHAMGDAAIAPAPTMWARAASMTYKSAPLVAQDMAALRAGLDNFQLPPNASGLASSDAPLGEFVAWAKSAKPDQLPSISYGILSEGELGRYSPGMLGPGSITMNHYIREMPADERAAVLFHELYHYWDNKVARLHYANVSYGYIDPAHMPEHEYDAYYLTALYRQANRREGDPSRLGQFLDKLPADPAAVRAMVDRTVQGQR